MIGIDSKNSANSQIEKYSLRYITCSVNMGWFKTGSCLFLQECAVVSGTKSNPQIFLHRISVLSNNNFPTRKDHTMYKFFLLFVLLLPASFLQAQSTTTVLKEKSLIKGQTVYLNSKARLGGKSRIVLPVKLPANTVSWYYSFSTVKTNDAATKLEGSGLEIQIAKLIANGALNVIKAGMVTNVVSHLVKPTGSGVVDIYLTDNKGFKEFEKKDLVGMYDVDVPTFYQEGTAQNSRNGVFQIPVVRNDLYLCIKNPSVTEGVAISVDVVAIVAAKEYRDIWSAESVEAIYKDCLNEFSIRDSETEAICDCSRNQIKSIYTPSKFALLSPSERAGLLRNTIKVCSEKDGLLSQDYKDNKLIELAQLAAGQMITKDYKGAAKSYNELINAGITSTDIYYKVGFSQLCAGQFDEARKNLSVGLGKEPQDMYLLTNLAYYYLLTADFNEADKIFEKFKGKRFPNKQKFKDVVAQDLSEFERLGRKNKHFTQVRENLRID